MKRWVVGVTAVCGLGASLLKGSGNPIPVARRARRCAASRTHRRRGFSGDIDDQRATDADGHASDHSDTSETSANLRTYSSGIANTWPPPIYH